MMTKLLFVAVLFGLIVLATACGGNPPPPPPVVEPEVIPLTETPVPTVQEITLTPSPTIPPTPVMTPTPDGRLMVRLDALETTKDVLITPPFPTPASMS